MRSVGAFEAKTHFSQMVDEVNRTGEPIVVQRRGKNMAVLEPYTHRDKVKKGVLSRRVLNAFSEIRSRQKNEGTTSIRELIQEGRER